MFHHIFFEFAYQLKNQTFSHIFPTTQDSFLPAWKFKSNVLSFDNKPHAVLPVWLCSSLSSASGAQPQFNHWKSHMEQIIVMLRCFVSESTVIKSFPLLHLIVSSNSIECGCSFRRWRSWNSNRSSHFSVVKISENLSRFHCADRCVKVLEVISNHNRHAYNPFFLKVISINTRNGP